MDGVIKIAGIQITPDILKKDRNLERCLELIKTAAKEQAQLIVFPEATLSGYVFNSLEEALPVAETIPGRGKTCMHGLVATGALNPSVNARPGVSGSVAWRQD